MAADEARVDPASRVLANLRIERALLDALDALGTIVAVSFKGPLLTRLVFGDLSRRISSDNDLLVHPRDFRAALEALAAHGYRPWRPEHAPSANSSTEPGFPSEHDLGQLCTLDEVELHPPEGRVQVVLDLHQRAFSLAHFGADERVVWENIAELVLHGRSVNTFGNELAMVHLVGHSVAHWLDDKNVADVREAWQRLGPRLDASRLRCIAEQTISLRTFETVLYLADPTAGSTRLLEPRGSGLARAAAGLLSRALPATSSVAGRAALVSLLTLPTARLGHVLVQLLFPGRAELERRFGSGSLARHLARHLRHAASKFRSTRTSR